MYTKKNYINQYNLIEKLFFVGFCFCNAPRLVPSSTFSSSITKLAEVFIQPWGSLVESAGEVRTVRIINGTEM